MTTPSCVLTIGGIDPCGAFGAPADLKTFAAWRVHGMVVTTVVTAQNSTRWLGAEYLPANLVAAQLDAVFQDYGAAAVKTGFIGRVDLLEVIAAKLGEYQVANLVVDPVLVDGRHEALFGAEVTAAYRELLLPLARVVTPNQGEARLLSGRPLNEPVTWTEAWPDLVRLAPQATWLVKGDTHQGGFGDWLVAAGSAEFLLHDRLPTGNLAGTGDTLSAAAAAGLARGLEAREALHAARAFTWRAIHLAAGWRLVQGRGPTANFTPADDRFSG